MMMRRSMDAAAAAMAAVMITGCLLQASVVLVAEGAQYPVGGNDGWTFQNTATYYTDWAQSKKLVVGDSLYFLYEAGLHSVMEVSEADYQTCTVSSPLQTWSEGNAEVTLTLPGWHYYICGFPGHCQAGMALAVNVLPAGGAQSPSSSATSPPLSTTASPPINTPLAPPPSTTTASSPLSWLPPSSSTWLPPASNAPRASAPSSPAYAPTRPEYSPVRAPVYSPSAYAPVYSPEYAPVYAPEYAPVYSPEYAPEYAPASAPPAPPPMSPALSPADDVTSAAPALSPILSFLLASVAVLVSSFL